MGAYEDFLEKYGKGAQQQQTETSTPVESAPSEQDTGRQQTSSYDEFLSKYGGNHTGRQQEAQPVRTNPARPQRPQGREATSAVQEEQPVQPARQRPAPSPLRDPGNRLARVQDDTTQQRVQTPQKSFASDPFDFLFNQPKQAQQQEEQAKQPSDPTAEAGRGKTLPGGQRMETIDPGRLTQESGAEDYSKQTLGKIAGHGAYAAQDLEPKMPEATGPARGAGLRQLEEFNRQWDRREEARRAAAEPKDLTAIYNQANADYEALSRDIEALEAEIPRLEEELRVNGQYYGPEWEQDLERKRQQLEAERAQLEEARHAREAAFLALPEEQREQMNRNFIQRAWAAVQSGTERAVATFGRVGWQAIDGLFGRGGVVDTVFGGIPWGVVDGAVEIWRDITGSDDTSMVDPLGDLAARASNTAGQYEARAAARLQYESDPVKAASDILYNTEIMLPYLLLVKASGGTSIIGGAEYAGAGTTAGLEYLSAAESAGSSWAAARMAFGETVRLMAHDAGAQWTWLTQFAESAATAREEGADGLEILTYALTNASVNTLVEMGGGLQRNLGEGLRALRPDRLARTMLEESGEEELQHFFENGLKQVYKNVELYSEENPEALINPDVMTQIFIDTALTTPFIVLEGAAVDRFDYRRRARVAARNQATANEIEANLENATKQDGDEALIAELEKIESNRRLSRVFKEMYKTSPQEAIESIRQTQAAAETETPSVSPGADSSLRDGATGEEEGSSGTPTPTNPVRPQEAAGRDLAQGGTETAAQAPQNATAQAPVLNSQETQTAPTQSVETQNTTPQSAEQTAPLAQGSQETQGVETGTEERIATPPSETRNDSAEAQADREAERIWNKAHPYGPTLSDIWEADKSSVFSTYVQALGVDLDMDNPVVSQAYSVANDLVAHNGLPGRGPVSPYAAAAALKEYLDGHTDKDAGYMAARAYQIERERAGQSAAPTTQAATETETPSVSPAADSSLTEGANGENRRYRELGEQYGTIEPGEIPSRKSSVPKKSGENEVVSKTARTLYEAAATPDRLLPTIQAAVVNGDLSHIPVENKTLANNAATMLRMKGFDTALRDWTADVRAGKRSDELTAMGAVLYNNAANSNIDGKALVDLIMDYTYLTSGTGSALNAAKILKRLSPEGKIYSVQKAVNEINSARNVDAARRAKKSAKKAQKTARKSATETETAKGTTNTAEETESKAAEETENRKVTEEDNVPVSEWAERAGESVADSLADKLRAQADGKVTEKKLKTMCQIAEEDVKKILKSYGTKGQNLDARALENILTNPAFYNTLYNSLRSSLQTKATMSAEEIAELGHEWIDKPLADILAQMAAQQSDIHVNEGLVKAYLDVSNLTKEDGTPLSAEQQDAMRDEIMDAILKDIARQVPSTIGEKIRAIRYLYMLGNLKTQGRNVIGNTASTAMRIAKDTVKGTLELGLHAVTGGRYERTTSLWVPPSLMSECLKDFLNVKDVAMGEAKYSDGRASNVRREIEEKKRVFKPSGTWGTDKATGAITGSKAAKALRTAVDAAEWLPEGYRLATKWAMEFGDLIFSGENYAASLARYLYAHKVSSIEDASPELLDKARAYAVRQAQETTFRDSNAVSTWVSGLGRNAPLLVRGAISGALPFRKTPANVLVRAYEYSPLGVLTSFKYAYDMIRSNGKATGQDLVDMLSKNLTGTGLFLLGMLLHRRGWLRTKDDDDKLEQFHKDQGAQDWSLDLKDGRSYTLDWLAPASMPLFMGAVYDQLDADEDISGNDALRLIASLSEPMMEMSMLSGLNDSIEAATARNAPLPPILQFGLNSLLNMASQTGVNSLYRQYEQAQEENRSTYWTDPDSKLPEIVQKALAQSSVGLPGPGYQRMDYVDAWGRKQDKGSTGERYLQAFVSPWYKGKDRSTPYDAELERLYKDGYTNAIPQAPSRNETWKTEDGASITIGKEDYEKYAIEVGQNKLELVGEFMDSEEYKKLDDETRAAIINNLYEYAVWQARRNYTEDHGASMPTNSKWESVESVEKAGVDPAAYLLGKKQADTDESGSLNQKEVFSWLLGSDYSNGQKRTIWNETTGGSTSWDQYRDKHPAAILAGLHVDEDRAAAIATEINGGKADWSNVSSLSNEELYDYYAKHPDQERYVKALYNAKGSDTSWDEMVEEQEAKDAKDPVNVLTRDFGYSQRDAERLWKDINTDRVNGVTQAEFYSFYQRHPELRDELRAMWAAHWPKHKGIDYYKPKK